MRTQHGISNLPRQYLFVNSEQPNRIAPRTRRTIIQPWIENKYDFDMRVVAKAMAAGGHATLT
jgi:hypothetical protein